MKSAARFDSGEEEGKGKEMKKKEVCVVIATVQYDYESIRERSTV